MNSEFNLEKFPEEVIETDILIVGGGLAGSMTAIRAKENSNVDVTIIEKTTIRRGSVGATGTDHWAIPHPKTNALTAEKYGILRAKDLDGMVSKKLCILAAKQGIKTLPVMESIGVNITEDNGTVNMIQGALGSGPERGTGRDHAYYRGADLKFKLEAEVRRRGVKVYERTILTSVITRGDSVIGATALNYRTGKFLVIKAKATVLATGGPYRLYQHRYGTFPSNMWVERVNPWNCCGGHADAYRAGAKLANLEFGHPVIFPAGMANLGATMLNAMENQEGENLYQKYLLDTPRSKGETGIGWAKYPYQPKGNPEIERNVIWATYESLPPEAQLQWLFTCAQESPSGLKLFRDRGGGRAAPIELSQWIHGLNRTVSGVCVDERGETSLKGLFAAGDVLGRIGMSGSAASTGWGYLIGNYLREYTPGIERPALGNEEIRQVQKEKERVFGPLGRKDGVNALELNDFVSRRLDDLVGYKKIEPKLKRAVQTFETLEKEFVPYLSASNFHELMRAIEVQDILEIAKLHASSSLIRKETRNYPQHYRVDYPEKDDSNWRKVITVQRQDNKMVYTMEKMDE
jgi:succinate dehydrogenase/fumarate reductase flavoprotein subunit